MTSSVAAAEERKLSATAERFCRQFSLAEIRSATGDFNDEHLIGKGGFGKVYRGKIDDSQQTVAMKRLAPNSNQGEAEFLTEIETLSKLRHMNLVSLVGYCNENGEMILVYEYIPKGTLADHLYRNRDGSSLTWKQLLNICIGAARGIDYLHTGTSIIHRDVKSTNILLDEYFTAKVSDFGLAKHLSTSSSKSHVSTLVKGSFGYLDPSYFTTCRLTRKSDTYSFGVVLLEVLCGRAAVDSSLGEDEMGLAMWAQEKLSKGKAEQIVASNLRDEISADCLKTFVGIAKKCLNREPKMRPTMAQVVVQLEFALEQQDRKASTLNASRFLPFWNRVKPTESRATVSSQLELWQGDVNTPSTATQEEALNVNMLPVSVPVNSISDHEHKRGLNISPIGHPVAVDEPEDQMAVDVEPIAVPAISIHELKAVTNSFSSQCLISNELRGRVYRGTLRSGQVAAIKMVHYGHQSFAMFQEQVKMISSLKHENMVQLLGYCMGDRRQFLAYEFAPNRSLHDILHGQGVNGSNPNPALSWSQRVQIAMGAAKGLKYIHEKSQIHFNIKSSNILLFDDYKVAKIADFGWSAESSRDSLVDSGYYHPLALADLLLYDPPEYRWSGELSSKSDVYSFGVVLLELLTGGEVIDRTRPRGLQHLVEWTTPWLSKDKVKKVVDASLKGDYPAKAVAKMAEIAAMCVKFDAEFRPSMKLVVRALRPLLNANSDRKT